MAESLNVIALISGGKDSFFSILHCLQNGHKVVALANLFPGSPAVGHVKPFPGEGQEKPASPSASEDEQDLNSFMYQTVGHTVIPLYAEALGLPLYRQAIVGTAVETSLSYSPQISSSETADGTGSINSDETESLIPLLKSIIAAHPEANAVSTGAILSTYQRTRIESVALRLGLTPLSYLWQFPILPPGLQIALLQDMQAVDMDARIIKVASGGLDEEFLWENVASVRGMGRVERAMKRFGVEGDGAVIGEGGEFETLVLNGPSQLFKGRILVEEEERKVVREGGGAAWLAIGKAKVEMKNEESAVQRSTVRTPSLWDAEFSEMLSFVRHWSMEEVPKMKPLSLQTKQAAGALPRIQLTDGNTGSNWTTIKRQSSQCDSITQEVDDIILQVRQLLEERKMTPTDIISTVIILRSMKDFASVNKIYGALFTSPNPPSRVTIACGDSLLQDHNVVIHWKVSSSKESLRRGLHVQSRSYWAPANIGPYSQAQSTALSLSKSENSVSAVYIAGQIPLIPGSMVLPSAEGSPDDFIQQSILSLQHLWRIGVEMGVVWWTSAVSYIPRSSLSQAAEKGHVAGQAWIFRHRQMSPADEDEQERDLWEERHHGGLESRGRNQAARQLPDWEIIDSGSLGTESHPPSFTAEVEELPRGSGIEWHAHVGLSEGPLQVLTKELPEVGAISQCTVANEVQYTTIMLSYAEELHDVNDRVSILKGLLEDRLELGGAEIGDHAAYVDVSITGLCQKADLRGVVPCRSLWDIKGERLAAVFLYCARARPKD